MVVLTSPGKGLRHWGLQGGNKENGGGSRLGPAKRTHNAGGDGSNGADGPAKPAPRGTMSHGNATVPGYMRATRSRRALARLGASALLWPLLPTLRRAARPDVPAAHERLKDALNRRAAPHSQRRAERRRGRRLAPPAHRLPHRAGRGPQARRSSVFRNGSRRHQFGGRAPSAGGGAQPDYRPPSHRLRRHRRRGTRRPAIRPPLRAASAEQPATDAHARLAARLPAFACLAWQR